MATSRTPSPAAMPDTILPRSTYDNNTTPCASESTPFLGQGHCSCSNDMIDKGILSTTDYTADCNTAIEFLFGSLPSPTQDDQNGDLEEQATQYKSSMRVLLFHSHRRVEHSKDCKLLTRQIIHILRHAKHVDIRSQFIEAVSQVFYGRPNLNFESARCQYQYFYNWIYSGRQESDSHCRTKDFMGTIVSLGRNFVGCDLSHLDESITKPERCACCHQEKDIVYWCERCVQKDGSRKTIMTGYCSSHCQSDDTVHHETVCNVRKCFGRAVRLTKSIFMSLQEWLTDSTVECTSNRHGTIFVTDKLRYWEAMRGEPALHPFIRNRNIREGHIEAVIQDQYAMHISGPMNYYVIPWLWNGLCEEIEEVIVQVKNAHRPIIRVIKDQNITSNMLRPHLVYRVTLKSGEVVAVDLAGGRYGWAETLMSWDHFKEQRVSRIIASDPPGTAASQLGHNLPYNYPSLVKIRTHREVLTTIIQRLRELQGRNWLSMHSDTDFLATSDPEHYSHIKIMMRKVVTRLCKLKAFNILAQSDTHYRLFLNHDFEELVAVTPTERRLLKRAWLTKEQTDMLADKDRTYLKHFWKYHLEQYGIVMVHGSLIPAEN
ncbi:hypothetical protein F5Y06DRAFT_308571 [Hypoxylon sp. FL0890]|nr:hypothetical protein F5Y06DRAFT_308571 [Hypoxylon sp. FL0890]